ncbi:MAG TPA: hypothetical protein VEC57_04930 [Candidatus Limnocylindrales bacterium]|nr:hypothetical protein [Candidatus Limnocylindrales bacterium]
MSWKLASRLSLSFAASLFALVLSLPAASEAAQGDCSQPVTSGQNPTASDCLYILKSAVGTEECEICVCDTTGNEEIQATDSLLCLKYAVGQPVELNCPECDTTTTSTSSTSTSSTSTSTTTTTLGGPTTTIDTPTTTIDTPTTTIDTPTTTLSNTTTTVDTPTTTIDTPTTTLVAAGACPGFGELTLYSGFGELCSNNADCPVGTCNNERGRCQTVTELDSGWTGLAHDSDINNETLSRGFLDCPGTGGACGVCSVEGLDPSIGNCRCANNNQAVCDEKFAADADDCGGQVCNCYFGAPFPLSSGGTPACIVNRFFEDISGTANPDTGSGAISANLRTQVFLGITTSNPCPVCGGVCSNDDTQTCIFDADCGDGNTCQDDPTANDGNRGGVCVDGRNIGTACDVNAYNTSFPAIPNAPGGAGYSIDCFPDTGKNVSGAGLVIQLTQTTGTQQLDFDVPCGNGDLLCACRQCTTDATVPCDDDADCASQSGACSVSNKFLCTSNNDCSSVNAGTCLTIKRCSQATSLTCNTNTDCLNRNVGQCNPSTCSANGTGGFPSPNQCQGGLCEDAGDEEGLCTEGPDESSCDAVVKANGDGILSCSVNADCEPASVGVDAGNCTLVKRRECFLDPIVATGQASPTMPVGASVFCIPPTSNQPINTVAGLPGPGRVTNQAISRTFCENAPETQYTPGVGGCPAE